MTRDLQSVLAGAIQVANLYNTGSTEGHKPPVTQSGSACLFLIRSMLAVRVCSILP